MMKPNAVLLATLLLGSTCLAAPTPVGQEARAIFYRFGEGYTQAAIDLAAPTKIKSSRADAGQTKREFNGGGIHASWIEVPDMPSKPVPMSLRISRNGHLVNDIHVGASSSADVQKQLGTPDESGANWIAYRGLAEICSDKFTFNFANGKLSGVEWQWCAD